MLRSILRSSPSAARRWSRHYSVKAEVASTAQPKDIDPAQLKITKTSKPGVLEKPENLVFGRKFSGWFRNLVLDPQNFVGAKTLTQ